MDCFQISKSLSCCICCPDLRHYRRQNTKLPVIEYWNDSSFNKKYQKNLAHTVTVVKTNLLAFRTKHLHIIEPDEIDFQNNRKVNLDADMFLWTYFRCLQLYDKLLINASSLIDELTIFASSEVDRFNTNMNVCCIIIGLFFRCRWNLWGVS